VTPNVLGISATFLMIIVVDLRSSGGVRDGPRAAGVRCVGPAPSSKVSSRSDHGQVTRVAERRLRVRDPASATKMWVMLTTHCFCHGLMTTLHTVTRRPRPRGLPVFPGGEHKLKRDRDGLWKVEWRGRLRVIVKTRAQIKTRVICQHESSIQGTRSMGGGAGIGCYCASHHLWAFIG